jgi:phosphate-selective porin
MKTCEKFNGYKALAEAIVIQACIDYLDTRKKLDEVALVDRETKKRLEGQLDELTRFFKSKWYRELSETDPKYMLEQLDKGYKELKRTNQLDRIKQLQRV